MSQQHTLHLTLHSRINLKSQPFRFRDAMALAHIMCDDCTALILSQHRLLHHTPYASSALRVLELKLAVLWWAARHALTLALALTSHDSLEQVPLITCTLACGRECLRAMGAGAAVCGVAGVT